jgi:hypothetical protein
VTAPFRHERSGVADRGFGREKLNRVAELGFDQNRKD